MEKQCLINLTYQTETVSTGRGLLTGETLSGNLTRAVGEAGGVYPIQRGTVDNATNENYEVAFVSDDLTIKNIYVPTEQLPPSTPVPPPTTTTATPTQPPPLLNLGAGGTSTGSSDGVSTGGIPTGGSGGTSTGGTSTGGTSTGGSGTGGTDTGTGGSGGTSTGTDGSSTSVSALGGRSASGGFTEAKPLIIAQPAASAFTYPIPESTFSHSNPAAQVTLEAKMVDGAPLPAWMSFDPVSKVITGTPPAGAVGEFEIKIIAKDQFGGEAQTLLKMNVGK